MSLSSNVAIICLSVAVAGLQGSQAQPARPHNSDLAYGDIVLKAADGISARPFIDAARDSRFRFPRRLTSVTIAFRKDYIGPRQARIKIATTQPPRPGLYTTAKGMSVFQDLGPNTIIIRVDGAKFLGAPLYVTCSKQEYRYPPRGVPSRGNHKCEAIAQLTLQTSVVVSFLDGLFPPSEWRALFGSVEAGIRSVAVLPRIQTLPTRDITVGDAVVKLTVPHRSPAPLVRVYLDRDPRFQYPGGFSGVYLFVELRGKDQWQEGLQRALSGPPAPDLYPAGNHISVFRHPNGGDPVVRVDGAKFLGQPLVVACGSPFRVPVGRTGEQRSERLCKVRVPLTAQTNAAVIFSDGLYPAWEWKALFQSLEKSIRTIIVLPRTH